MTIGTANLDTYIAINRPITSIVQERPEFTNIINGIGLFTARNIYKHPYTVSLNRCTLDYLVDDLDRNFVLSSTQANLVCN